MALIPCCNCYRKISQDLIKEGKLTVTKLTDLSLVNLHCKLTNSTANILTHRLTLILFNRMHSNKLDILKKLMSHPSFFEATLLCLKFYGPSSKPIR